MSTRQLGAETGPAQPLDRLAVETVGLLSAAEQRVASGLDTQGPIGARGGRDL